MGMYISSYEKQTTLTLLTDQPRGEFHRELHILSYRPLNTRCPLNVGTV